MKLVLILTTFVWQVQSLEFHSDEYRNGLLGFLDKDEPFIDIQTRWYPGACLFHGQRMVSPHKNSMITCKADKHGRLQAIQTDCERGKILNRHNKCRDLPGKGNVVCFIPNKNCSKHTVELLPHPDKEYYRSYLLCLVDGGTIVADCDIGYHFNSAHKRCEKDRKGITTLVEEIPQCHEAKEITCAGPVVNSVSNYLRRNHRRVPGDCRDCFYICTTTDASNYELRIECNIPDNHPYRGNGTVPSEPLTLPPSETHSTPTKDEKTSSTPPITKENPTKSPEVSTTEVEEVTTSSKQAPTEEIVTTTKDWEATTPAKPVPRTDSTETPKDHSKSVIDSTGTDEFPSKPTIKVTPKDTETTTSQRATTTDSDPTVSNEEPTTMKTDEHSNKPLYHETTTTESEATTTKQYSKSTTLPPTTSSDTVTITDLTPTHEEHSKSTREVPTEGPSTTTELSATHEHSTPSEIHPTGTHAFNTKPLVTQEHPSTSTGDNWESTTSIEITTKLTGTDKTVSDEGESTTSETVTWTHEHALPTKSFGDVVGWTTVTTEAHVTNVTTEVPATHEDVNTWFTDFSEGDETHKTPSVTVAATQSDSDTTTDDNYVDDYYDDDYDDDDDNDDDEDDDDNPTGTTVRAYIEKTDCSSIYGLTCESEGQFRVNHSCTQHYKCEHRPHCDKIVATAVYECSSCSKFNALTMTCDVPENVPECTYLDADEGFAHLQYNIDKRHCTGEGRFVVPEDCSQYYNCQSSSKGIRKTVETCPDRKRFNENTKQCEDNYECPLVHEICTARSYIFDRYSCEKFYYCTSGGNGGDSMFTMFCPKGYLFARNSCIPRRHMCNEKCIT